MKLSFKNILPILLIFTLLILFAGCFITPSDEQPGYTPGTITGIIAAPCCSTSTVEVILTYGKDKIDTTNTNENGEYTFTNVKPGKNYVITALCPDPVVKDVALKVVEGETYDAEITDCVSTSLGLVVDFLVTYTELGPEDIVLDPVIADQPDFSSFLKFKKLVEEVCRVSENCGNLTTDKYVQDALCKAAEEVGQIVIPDLDLGCTTAPGFAPGPGPGPTPDPCAVNAVPVINSITPDTATVGVLYSGQVNVTDDGTITKYEKISGPDWLIIDSSTGVLSGTPACDDVCSCFNEVFKVAEKSCDITVKVTDNCGASDEKSFCFEVISPEYTLTMAADPSAGGTATDETGTGPYAESTVVNIKAVANEGYKFVNWTAPAGTFGDANSAETTFTMPGQDVTVTANFKLKNIINYLLVRGYNSAKKCEGLQKTYEAIPEVPHLINTGLWLTDQDHTPNVKHINFIALCDDISTKIEYSYRYQVKYLDEVNPRDWTTWTAWSTAGRSSGDDGIYGYGFASDCMYAPSETSGQNKYYCYQFEIEIMVNGDLNTYIVNID